MWIKASTQLSKHVFQVTTPVSSHFLICGDKAALVDASISAVSPRLKEEISVVLPELSSLQYIFLTHSHFDHIAGVPLLRQSFPRVELACSPLCAELLSQQAYLRQCYQRDKACAEAMKVDMELGFSEWAGCFQIDRIVAEGDGINLGGAANVEVKVISCQGHSKDSLAFYVRPDAVVIAGEALGVYAGRERFYPAFSESYEKYLATLEKFADLDVSAIGFSHSGALTGKLAKDYVANARVAAEKFALNVKDRLTQGELVDQIYESLLIEWTKENIYPEGPFRASVEETLKNMVRAVAEGR